jgi:hypothetical protein
MEFNLSDILNLSKVRENETEWYQKLPVYSLILFNIIYAQICLIY